MSRFSFFFLATPPIKLKLHIHGGLLRANHLDQSLWSTNQKYWAAVRCNLLQLCCAFYQPRHAPRIWCRKSNFLSWTGTFWLFCNKFYCLETHTEHCLKSHTEHHWRCSYARKVYKNFNYTHGILFFFFLGKGSVYITYPYQLYLFSIHIN
jgi:hypothetical protein